MFFLREKVCHTHSRTKEENVICEESGVCRQERKVEPVGKYGRLNTMNKMNEEELKEALFQYHLEEKMAEELFEIY